MIFRCVVVVLATVVPWATVATLRAEDKLPLWPENSAEVKGVAPEHLPTLTLYHGPKSAGNKPAVVICPAGGYKHHSNSAGHAKWLNDLGVAAYVVTYRLPVHGYKHPAPLHDAQRAMRIVRQNAEAWGLDDQRIGVMGGSSGGHLAATLATHYDQGDSAADDLTARHGCRPDFVILSDAVITMQGKACHTPSRARLLPNDPSQELVDDLSPEKQVTPQTPPTFLFAGGQDMLVPAENSLLFFAALRGQQVKFCELHVTSHGGHGFQAIDWYDAAEGWLRRTAILPLPGTK